jgi:dTDP-glucose pyrophosphorylase
MIVDENLSPLLIHADATVREAMARLNSTPHIMQLVIDANKVLVGTVTDGDIRRLLLGGGNMESPVASCMRRNPIVATTVEEGISRAAELTGRLRCVPVVGADGRPIKVVSDAGQVPGVQTALIMAGGFGKRLGRLTQNTPKPLISVAGKPILRHLINDLDEHGVGRILIAAHYLSEQIDAFVADLPHRARIEVIVEKHPLGTAGALSLLPADISGPLLVLNGDIMTQTNFSALALHHTFHDRDATVGAARHEIEIPYGVIEHDERGALRAIREKPRYAPFVLAGIYLLEESIYRHLPDSRPLDMPDLLEHAIALDRNVGVFPIHEYWLDLGRPAEIDLAESTFPRRNETSESERGQ